MKSETKGENLIPIEQVLDDMYSDSGVQSAARDYYYIHYATEAERKSMRREDHWANVIAGFIVIGAIVSFIVTIL